MAIGVLGPLATGDSGLHLNPRDRVVLSALAMRAGETMTPDQLADALWGDTPPASWAKNLQSCVVRLRKALGPDSIETTPHGYRLVSVEAVDLTEFEGLVARGRELLALNEPERASYHLGRALELWRGRPLAELEDWEPAIREARRLEELHLDAQDWWLEARLASGGHREAASVAESLVQAAPTRERRWHLLALAQYRSGRQADALATLRRARSMLANELGLDPGPDLLELEQAVLRQDPGLLRAAEPPRAAHRCPYPGLAAYDVADAEGFFGRESAVAAALDRLRRLGVLVVVGPSGCGKSSLVRAGVAAALRREGRPVAVLTPGAHPAAVLSDATRGRRGRTLVLVVDQAEEALTLCEDAAEQEAFLQAIVEHRERAPLVLAFRADRMGEVAGHQDLARLVEGGLFLLGGMEPEELRAAVLEPARQAGLVVEPGLVDLLVREVEGEPGALPLMSHALRETWARREGRSLTVAGYQESGGIRGAIAKSAEGIYTGIDAARRAAMRDLMLRLVLPGPEGEPLRTRMPRRLVVADRAAEELIDLLVSARLLTSEADVVTLAHEALARSWPRLRGWLDDDAEGQRLLHHLSSAADAWDSLGRPDSELYRGLRLTQALEWEAGPHPELTAVEQEFLAAGRALAEQERTEIEARAREQARQIRRQRVALVGVCGLLVLALVTGGLALWQQQVARDRGAAARAAAGEAEASALVATARRAGARALSTDDIDTSLLLAAAGARLHESNATRGNLLDALARNPLLAGAFHLPDGGPIENLAVSPDGKALAVFDRQGLVRLLDPATGEVRAAFRSPSTPMSRERVGPLAISPAGGHVAVGTPILSRHAVRLLDGESLEPAPVSFPGTTAPASVRHDRALALAFSADGSRLAGTFHRIGLRRWQDDDPTYEVLSASVRVWDTSRPASPRLLFERTLDGRRFEFKDRDVVGLSPDGRTVYTSRPLTAYDVRTGRRIWTSPHNGYVMDVSPDGRTIALDSDPEVLLLDAASGRVREILRGHTEEIWAVRFSPDGTRLASSADDATAIVWNTGSGEAVARLDLGENNVRGLAFSTNGRILFTGGGDRTVRLWDLRGVSSYISRLLAPGGFGFGWVIPSHDGRTTAHAVAGRGTFFMDAETGERTDVVGPKVGFSDGSWSRSGERFISTVGSRVQVWSREGRLLDDNRDNPLDGRGYDLDYTGDESRIVVTEEDGTVSMLDADTLAPVGRRVEFDERVCCVSGGPGDRTALVLVGGPPTPAHDSFEFNPAPDEWALLDLERGAIAARGEVQDAWFAEIAPDGATAAIGTQEGAVVLVDLETGEAVRPPDRAHETPCCWLSWSADGSTFVGSTFDGWVSLWDGRTGELIGRAKLPEVTPASVEFLPDGHTVFIATYTDATYLWETSLERALDHACRFAGRNLSRAEWETYFDDQPYLETCTTAQLRQGE